MVANEKNLIQNRNLTPSERRENAKKAGKASGKIRRQRKAMKEQMDMLLTLPFKQQEKLKSIKNLGIEIEQIDNQMALIVSIYDKALKGDVQAFNTIREITQDNQVINGNGRIEIINDLPKDNENES